MLLLLKGLKNYANGKKWGVKRASRVFDAARNEHLKILVAVVLRLERPFHPHTDIVRLVFAKRL